GLAGIVGLFPRGPIGEPVLVTSEKEAFRKFGSFSASHRGAEAVRGFFGEGGSRMYLVRTCHYTDPTNASTLTAVKATGNIEAVTATAQPAKVIASLAAPYNMAHDDRLDITITGPVTATALFQGWSAFVDSGLTFPFNLVGGEILNVRIDGGPLQALVVDALDIAIPGAATAFEVCNTLNRSLVGARFVLNPGMPAGIRLESDTKGTASIVEIVGGTAMLLLGFVAGVNTGIGNVADLSAVSVAEVKAIVEAGVANVVVNPLPGGLFEIATVATGGGESLLVVPVVSTAAVKLGLDVIIHWGSAVGSAPVLSVEAKYHGTYGNSVNFTVSDASSGVVSEFNLYVLEGGAIVERYPNVTMLPTALNYVVSKVNADSEFVVLTDLGIGTRPTNATTALLLGGDDGLVGIANSDYLGTLSAENGLYAFEKVAVVNMLSIPGVASAALILAGVAYCESRKGAIPVFFSEGPQGSSYTAISAFVNSGNLVESSESLAMAWPWTKILNPNPTVYGNEATITVAPSPLVMGREARTSSQIEGGIYQAPSGLLYGTFDTVLGVDSEDAKDVNKRDVVYPLRVNPIWGGDGVPYYHDGNRLMKSSGLYPGIGQRMGRSNVELELGAIVNYFRHLRARNKTREELGRVVTRYMVDQTKLGAFESDIPSEAFTVDVGKGLNPERDMRAGILRAAVRCRFVGALDWVIILIGPTPEEE
ncbi:MAG: hypothetical protein Q7U75_02200, partial [Desulfobacterales bacterium]|nr:hypothetical protein [Desulfobacterales bacterium]